MLRYVVLRHVCPPGYPRASHWDLMLQRTAGLQTWALAEPPDSPEPIVAEALGDHRADYLTYEGPVSQGRGTVTRWDEGTYTLERDDPSHLVVVLEGAKLVGRAELVRQYDNTSVWRYIYSAGPATSTSGI